MSDRADLPSLRRARAERRRLGPMVALAAIVAGGMAVGWWWPSSPPAGVLVEVVGDVPAPGWHRIAEPSASAALRAAGAPHRAAPPTALREGDRVVVSRDGVRVEPTGDPLLIALPVDVNTADAKALVSVPGIGHELAAAILEDRERRGPFYDLRELARVRGIGEGAVRELSPMLTVGDVGPRPPPPILDLNTATASQLERLPGIGPALAARIVEDRDRRGPFRRVEDLGRVKGIGPATVERVRPRARVGELAAPP